jgi:hypothetical protein
MQQILAIAAIIGIGLLPSRSDAKATWPEGYDLEDALRSAALVVAAEVTRAEKIGVTRGGKAVSHNFQFDFKPVRVVKGVFSRPTLSLTVADLRFYFYNRPGLDFASIAKGQHRLLILGRSSAGYRNIHRMNDIDQSIPLLTGADDPIVTAVQVLLDARNEPDRMKIVDRLATALPELDGPAALSLLASLYERTFLASQSEAARRAVTAKLASPYPLVREAAASVLEDMLEADYLNTFAFRKSAVDGLVAALKRNPGPLDSRTSQLRALGSAPDTVRKHPEAMKFLRLDAAVDTLAERRTQLFVLTALARSGPVAPNTLAHLRTVPLDAGDYEQQVALQAACHQNPVGARALILNRIERKKSLGLGVSEEISAFKILYGKAENPQALQALQVAILQFNLDVPERQAFIRSCQDYASPALVKPIAAMLDPRFGELRQLSLEMLLKIGTKDAAQAVRPILTTVVNLHQKLKHSAFLGRHGFADGYAYALEHMSEPGYREDAVRALADIRKPGTEEELLGIYRKSNDPNWKRSAMRALALLGHRSLLADWRAMAANLRDPHTASAMLALADLDALTDTTAVVRGLSSRNEQLATACAGVAGKLLKRGKLGAGAGPLTAKLAETARDTEATEELRRAALRALLVGEDKATLGPTLRALIRDASLTNRGILPLLRTEVKKRKLILSD